MATRNLTRKFVDIRNSAKANRSLNRYHEKDESSDSGLLVFYFFILYYYLLFYIFIL